MQILCKVKETMVLLDHEKHCSIFEKFPIIKGDEWGILTRRKHGFWVQTASLSNFYFN